MKIVFIGLPAPVAPHNIGCHIGECLIAIIIGNENTGSFTVTAPITGSKIVVKAINGKFKVGFRFEEIIGIDFRKILTFEVHASCQQEKQPPYKEKMYIMYIHNC